METTTTFHNVSLYMPNGFYGNIARSDCREVTVTTGLRYAQYSNAVKVSYTPAGKRKPRGIMLTYKPFLVILDSKDAFDPAAMFGTEVQGHAAGTTVSKSRYSCFDPRFESDFLAMVKCRNISPLFQLPENSVQ